LSLEFSAPAKPNLGCSARVGNCPLGAALVGSGVALADFRELTASIRLQGRPVPGVVGASGGPQAMGRVRYRRWKAGPHHLWHDAECLAQEFGSVQCNSWYQDGAWELALHVWLMTEPFGHLDRVVRDRLTYFVTTEPFGQYL
jgi:hypothetical protein